MPMGDTIQRTATQGFMLSGNGCKSTIEKGETFLLATDVNKFGAGKKMFNVYDINGNIIGYVTSGMAELIEKGDC